MSQKHIRQLLDLNTCLNKTFMLFKVLYSGTGDSVLWEWGYQPIRFQFYEMKKTKQKKNEKLYIGSDSQQGGLCLK